MSSPSLVYLWDNILDGGTGQRVPL
ncbi:hypothetical protein KL86CLO1_11547 [uncultured Eubacteriales bacterium]|uniref:Uncharacterized protein n=1 Tax=uncultured Eubacteriales bacterium TaxID=172733 RepID=A0A212JR94_9FIRM|nr:hypothetical protein KL86CLO1_11547 [uncultured Eubacteriales bacterium]